MQYQQNNQNRIDERYFMLDDFFIDGNLNTAIISDSGNKNVKDTALKLSKDILKSNGREKIDTKLNSNQLRKFYDSFLRVYNSRVNPNQKKVMLLMLKAHGEYSANRLKIKRFGIFLNNRINIVLKKDNEEFEKYMEALKLHFEALVGYFPKN